MEHQRTTKEGPSVWSDLQKAEKNWPASFCARHWDKCIVGTTSASEGGRRKRWLSLFWVQSAHVTSRLLPEVTPEKVWLSPSHHMAGLSGSENVCRPSWALFDSWGKWDVQKWMTPPSHHRMGEVGSEAHLSVAPTPRYTCSSPSAHSEWRSALPPSTSNNQTLWPTHPHGQQHHPCLLLLRSNL